MYFRLRDLLLLSALTSLPPCVNSIAPNNIVSRVPAPATIPGDKDSKGIPYIKSIEEFIKATVPAEKLNVIFYTNAKAHDIGLEFLHAKSPGLDGKGILYYDALTDEVVKGVNVDAKKDKDAWWVWVYRASTALGRTTDSEDVYIALDPSDCRSIFSPVQTYKSDGRIDTVGVGQVWRQAELPALLSNDKVKRIYSVCKRNGQLQTKLEFPDDEGECPDEVEGEEYPDYDEVDHIPAVPGSIRPKLDGSHEPKK